jgi:hypothetical protein
MKRRCGEVVEFKKPHQQMKRIWTLLSVVCLCQASLTAHALNVSYIGPENITEEVAVDEESPADPDLLFSKKEPRVIGRREVIKGVCRSGQPFKVVQNGAGWSSETPKTGQMEKGQSPSDVAFLACGEVVPSLTPTKSVTSAAPVTAVAVPVMMGGVVQPVLAPKEERLPFKKLTLGCESFATTTLACFFRAVDMRFKGG